MLEAWKPVTELGQKVKRGEIVSLDQIFEMGEVIKEAEIVDMLNPDLHSDLLLIGQAKGKFGGGKRRIFRQTQKKTREGNTIKFTTCAVVGNKNGYVGIALGKSKETVPARDKAVTKAKLNLIKIRRGCGAWEGSADVNSIPFAVQGKCGSTIVTLFPAPKGTGLCIESECAKILEAAGIRDIWSKTEGQTKTKVNLVQACMNALRGLSEMKIQTKHFQTLGIVEGSYGETKKVAPEISSIEEIQAEMKEEASETAETTETKTAEVAKPVETMESKESTKSTEAIAETTE
ncbi:30S ribosomal protein S5 [archaeon]|nr:30S ribosomal protein S5 [archaeon]